MEGERGQGKQRLHWEDCLRNGDREQRWRELETLDREHSKKVEKKERKKQDD